MSTDQTAEIITTAKRAEAIEAPSYSVPGDWQHRADELRDAYARGVEAARNAASWTTDGNGDPLAYSRMLRGIEDGDPEVLDALPHPDLSGQWADDPTPQSLARDVLNTDDVDPEDVDMIAEVWEEGRDAILADVIAAELLAACPDPDMRAAQLWRDAGGILGAALEAARALDLSPAELSGVLTALRAEHLSRVGLSVSYGPDGVSISATGGALYLWAQGSIDALPNRGTRWPCSTLSSDHVDTLRLTFTREGLTDIDVGGLLYSNHDGLYWSELDAEGQGIGESVELTSDELDAMVSDVLVGLLPVDHPVWFVAVGQHLDAEDPRRIFAQTLRA